MRHPTPAFLAISLHALCVFKARISQNVFGNRDIVQLCRLYTTNIAVEDWQYNLGLAVCHQPAQARLARAGRADWAAEHTNGFFAHVGSAICLKGPLNTIGKCEKSCWATNLLARIDSLSLCLIVHSMHYDLSLSLSHAISLSLSLYLPLTHTHINVELHF